MLPNEPLHLPNEPPPHLPNEPPHLQDEPPHLPNEPPPLQDERLPEESLYDDPVLLDNLAGAGELVVPVVPHQLQDTLTRAGGHKEKGYFFLTLVVFSFVNVH